MKKKMCITLILITGFLAFFLLGKQVIKKENPNKPKVDLTVYTISSSDTQKWNAVKELETKEAIYPITVKEAASSEEIFSNIVADGAAMGFGVSEEEVKQFNHNFGNTIEDSKNNKLIEIEYFTFSNANEGFIVANFDYGKKEFNSQKKEKKELYKKLYEAFKK
ncbi:hypothetical protein DIX61_00545 [Streptococcus iniae]|uniref:Uncharacterized protein n=2 Tax=Streptococcus iniae TaxID=1346 RepID=A0A3L8I590_STRIN|nr:hypothetical protein [Streptococcus iniae]AJG25169.1 hypothetical protein SI82_00690 [Streptococcus iniae]ATX38885.1 hypothetical protein CTW00_00684 [Streptococcus iniae]EKB52245.1 hypothetical protein A0G_0080 [Streptococcus iniae 9117]ELY5748256.1 hypothetical protein [Streptococcus iniae]ELY5750624.1 hypothetical protein [Streptococcus iniae]